MPRWLSPSKQKVLKALFKGSVLLPYHAASETVSSLANDTTFRFGAAYSAKPLLSTAVVDCVNAIKTQLGPGRHPHFCQLLVTAEAHGTHIEHAPSVQLCHLVKPAFAGDLSTSADNPLLRSLCGSVSAARRLQPLLSLEVQCRVS